MIFSSFSLTDASIARFFRRISASAVDAWSLISSGLIIEVKILSSKKRFAVKPSKRWFKLGDDCSLRPNQSFKLR